MYNTIQCKKAIQSFVKTLPVQMVKTNENINFNLQTDSHALNLIMGSVKSKSFISYAKKFIDFAI